MPCQWCARISTERVRLRETTRRHAQCTISLRAGARHAQCAINLGTGTRLASLSSSDSCAFNLVPKCLHPSQSGLAMSLASGRKVGGSTTSHQARKEPPMLSALSAPMICQLVVGGYTILSGMLVRSSTCKC